MYPHIMNSIKFPTKFSKTYAFMKTYDREKTIHCYRDYLDLIDFRGDEYLNN